MDGVRVGKRVIGAQAPVTVGWENTPKVEGGPVKLLFFTWFQPVMLFALIAFWFYAPNSIAKASTAVAIGVGLKMLLLALEWRYCQTNRKFVRFNAFWAARGSDGLE